MTKKTIATTAPRKPVGLSSIAVSTTIRPIVEDLAALAQRLPEAPTDIARFAGLPDVQPSLPGLVARASFHQGELERWVRLLSKNTTVIDEPIDTFNALNLLRQGSYLALALLEPRNADDKWAKDTIGATLVKAAKRRRDTTRAGVLRTAFGIVDQPKKDPAPISEMAGWLKETSRRMGLIRPPAPQTSADELADAGFYRLEEASSLVAFFAAAPNLASLTEQAMDFLLLADAWSQEVGETDQPRESAAQSALTLAYAAITRVGLWPARTERDLHAKAACRAILRDRAMDPASLRAVASMAYEIGNEMAALSDQFTVEPQHETERFPGQG
ncbi:hypothetical protein [Bosea sp. (in: a-proteobacteria)]|uniref:hypothetical protein n=1 Tax=Bosea sp. (in: a-proteobacteria) TaxID=1871050 RepID=UPI003F6FBD27